MAKDVLAVWRMARQHIELCAESTHVLAAMDEAHDRIAKLIAADVECDEAENIARETQVKLAGIERELRIYGKGPGACRESVAKRIAEECVQALLTLYGATRKRAAALAACRGL